MFPAGESTKSLGVLELMNAVEVKESISSLTGMQSDDILSWVELIAGGNIIDECEENTQFRGRRWK